MLKQYANLQSLSLARAIYVDDNGYLGTEYPLGTKEFPVLTLAQAIVIAAARNNYNLRLHGTHQLLAAMEHYNFLGYEHLDIADLIDLNAQDVDSSGFWRLVITGTQGGTGFAFYNNCVLTNVVSLRGMLHECMLFGTNALATGGGTDNIDFHKCHAMMGAATITVNSPDLINFFDFEGELILQTMTGGEINIYSSVGTQVIINNTCTAGTINIYGNAIVTDNSVGTVVNDYTLDQRTANIDTQLDSILVQVPFFVEMDTINGGVITLFSFDALGATIREVFISFYIPASAGTFTLTWEKTRPGDLVTFTEEIVGAPSVPMAVIAVPGAGEYYSFRLGEIAQGLQGRFRIAEDANPAATIDAYAIVLMEL